MDIIKIFMALLPLASRSWGRFWFTSVSLQTVSTDWQFLTKSETDLKVELKMTELLAILEQTNLVVSNILTSWPTLLALSTVLSVTLLEQTGLLTTDGLTSWQTLLTLQTIRSVALLEQTVLLTFNGSTSWLTLLVLQTLRLVALLEKTRLLRFNILMS